MNIKDNCKIIKEYNTKIIELNKLRKIINEVSNETESNNQITKSNKLIKSNN